MSDRPFGHDKSAAIRQKRASSWQDLTRKKKTCRRKAPFELETFNGEVPLIVAPYLFSLLSVLT